MWFHYYCTYSHFVLLSCGVIGPNDLQVLEPSRSSNNLTLGKILRMKKGHQGVGLTHSKQGSWLTMHVMVVPGTQLNTILID